MVKASKEQYLFIAIFTNTVQFLKGELYKFKSLRGERTRWMLIGNLRSTTRIYDADVTLIELYFITMANNIIILLSQ